MASAMAMVAPLLAVLTMAGNGVLHTMPSLRVLFLPFGLNVPVHEVE